MLSNPKIIGILVILAAVAGITYVSHEPDVEGAFITNASQNQKLTDGLVGLWSFNGPDMTPNVRDASGTGNHGNLSGQTSTTSVRGRIGQALSFDGVDDFVNVPDHTSLQPGSGSWSVSVWANPRDQDQNLTLLGKIELASPFEQYFLGICGNGGCSASGQKLNFFYAQNSTNRYRIALSDDDVTDGNWHHYAAVADNPGDTIRLYKDGVLLSSTVQTSGAWPVIDNPDRLTLGFDNNATYWDRSLDDVRVYDRALSAEEVKRLYLMGASTVVNASQNKKITDGLVGLWSFNGPDMDWSTALVVRDQSGQNNHGSTTNMSTTTSPIGGRIGQALNFNGNENVVRLGNGLDNLGPLTISAWLRPNQTISSTQIIFITDGLASGDGYALNFMGTNAVRFYVDYNPTQLIRLSSNNSVTVG